MRFPQFITQRISRHPRHWQLPFVLIFVAALAATVYFTQIVKQNNPTVPPAGYLAAEKGYGVTLDLTQYDEATLAATLDTLRENGLFWLRQPVLWSNIETAPGQFNWDSLD